MTLQRIPGIVGLYLMLASSIAIASYPIAPAEHDEATSHEPTIATTTVGLPVKIEQLVIPGSLLDVRPLEGRNAPFVVRILQSYPHGTDHRYDLELYSLEAGRYNLSEYLQRQDGSTAEIPEYWIEVQSTLEQGQVLPQALRAANLPHLGGYRTAWILGTLFWLAGLAIILLWMQPPQKVSDQIVMARPSLADRLRPLVEKASTGNLRSEERATLERTLIAFWAARLQFENLPPGELIGRLKQHDQSGPMMGQLEKWLHQPSQQAPVDIESWLAPFKEITEIPAELGSYETREQA